MRLTKITQKELTKINQTELIEAQNVVSWKESVKECDTKIQHFNHKIAAGHEKLDELSKEKALLYKKTEEISTKSKECDIKLDKIAQMKEKALKLKARIEEKKQQAALKKLNGLEIEKK